VIPKPGKSLRDVSEKVASLVPELTSLYAMTNAAMISMLIQALSLDAERGVANRLDDINEILEIFSAADGVSVAGGKSPPGADQRGQFARGKPASLHLDVVDKRHEEGMQLLINLHAWAEIHSPQVNVMIWDFLQRHTERNKLDE
jgi:hypothetical protein